MHMPGTAQATSQRILPLVNGDRMSRDEFERRFDATPNLKKAELIEGRVYVPPPVSIEGHRYPHADVITWLNLYRASTPFVCVGGDGSVRMDMDNMPQPDAFMLITSEAGGRTRMSEDDYVEGAPELIVEVAASSSSYDLHEKMQVYRRNGVNEYIVFRTLQKAIDYFVFHGSEYVRHSADANDNFQSICFPGLWLDTQALIAGDIAGVLAYLQKGIASPEHAAFVSRLKAAAQGVR